MDYRGKVVVMTGASSGIGYEAAKAFAQRGATVVAVARREGLLQRLIEECRKTSPESYYVAGDLGDRAVARRRTRRCPARTGRRAWRTGCAPRRR